MPQETMAAWQLEEFGGDHLKLGRRRIPAAGPDEVVVKVGAASLNYRDKLVVNGHLLPELPDMPFVPVSDFAGEVVEIGADVSRVKVGERVMGHFWTEWTDGPPPPSMRAHGQSLGGPLQGALAEYVAIPQAAAVPTPPNLSDAEAATLPVAALTAWFALAESDTIGPDDVVLIHGTGGVAIAALQLAQAMGANVIVTSRSRHKLERVRDLGAWATIFNTEASDWPANVLELTDGHGADNVIETIGGQNVQKSLAAIAMEGQLSQIGFLQGPDLSISAVPLMLSRARIQGVSVGHRAAFERLAAFVDHHRIRPVIDSSYAFDAAPTAFERLEQGPFGKVVVNVNA